MDTLLSHLLDNELDVPTALDIAMDVYLYFVS